MKKYVKILLLIVIIILIVLLSVFFIAIQDPSYDKSENLTKEQVQEILNKRMELDNVYTKRTEKYGDFKNKKDDYIDEEAEYYMKGDIIKLVTEDESGNKRIIYSNKLEDSKGIDIDEANKRIIVSTVPSRFVDLYGLDFNLEDKDYFKYLGKTEVDGRTVIAIKIYEDENLLKNIIYIDEETGLISKDVCKHLFKEVAVETLEIKLGIVTDEDVETIDYKTVYPDYEVIELA